MDKTKFAFYGDSSKKYGDPNRLYGGPFDFDHRIELWNGTTLSEILNPILESCSWSYDRLGGCSDGSVVIKAAWTDYATVTTSWVIKIRVRFEASVAYEIVYSGEIIVKRRIIDEIERIEFALAGYQDQLAKTVIYRHPVTDEPAAYSSMTPKEILLDLLDSYITVYTDVTYRDGDIQNPPINIENIVFDSSALSAVQLLATISGNYEWGIDGNGYLHFKAKSTTRDWNFYPGDYLEYSELEEDRTDLVNRLYLTGNYGLDEILEDENDATTTAQATADYNFILGKITTYNELMQTFTGISRIKDLTLQMSKVGFSNLISDGNMEKSDTGDWPYYGSWGVKEKLTDTPYEGLQYLHVNPPGTNSGVHQMLILTGGNTYKFSCAFRTKSSLYNVKFQIYNISDDIEILYYADNPKSWKNYSTTFTVGGSGSKIIYFRVYGANFDLDDARLTSDTADDIDVWLVNAAAPAVALKSFTIPHGLIPSYPLTTPIKIGVTYDFLNPATLYGIRLKRQGSLNDLEYYYLLGTINENYPDGNLKYSSDAGVTWVNYGSTSDAYFVIESSQSQATYGVRSERGKNNSLGSIEDARLWANSYLGGRNYPRKRGVLRMTSRMHWFDRYKPLGLISVRSSSGTQIEYLIDKIQYGLGENGLDITLELGSKIPKISDYLAWIEHQLEGLRG